MSKISLETSMKLNRLSFPLKPDEDFDNKSLRASDRIARESGFLSLNNIMSVLLAMQTFYANEDLLLFLDREHKHKIILYHEVINLYMGNYSFCLFLSLTSSTAVLVPYAKLKWADDNFFSLLTSRLTSFLLLFFFFLQTARLCDVTSDRMSNISKIKIESECKPVSMMYLFTKLPNRSLTSSTFSNVSSAL